MLEFNLLPQQEKIEFKNVLKFRFAVFFSIWFFFCFLLFLFILIFSNYYLKIQVFGLEKRLDFEKKLIQQKEIENFEVISLKINNNLLKIKEIQDKSIPIYDILKDLSLKTKTIKLQNIVFLPNLKEVSLVGVADSRDSLLKFKSDIENASYVQSVDLPIHFLVKQKNIDFALKIKIR